MLDQISRTYKELPENSWQPTSPPSKHWGRKRGIGEWKQHFFEQRWQTLPIIGNGRAWWEELQRYSWIIHVFPGCWGGWQTGVWPTPCKTEVGELARVGLGSRVSGSNRKDLNPLESYFKYAGYVNWVLWEAGAELESEEQMIYWGKKDIPMKNDVGRSSIGHSKPETTREPDAVLDSQWETPTWRVFVRGSRLGHRWPGLSTYASSVTGGAARKNVALPSVQPVGCQWGVSANCAFTTHSRAFLEEKSKAHLHGYQGGQMLLHMFPSHSSTFAASISQGNLDTY